MSRSPANLLKKKRKKEIVYERNRSPIDIAKISLSNSTKQSVFTYFYFQETQRD